MMVLFIFMTSLFELTVLHDEGAKSVVMFVSIVSGAVLASKVLRRFI